MSVKISGRFINQLNSKAPVIQTICGSNLSKLMEAKTMMKKLLLAIFLFTVCAASAAAQSNPEQAVLNARDQFFDIKKRSIELERVKRDANKPIFNKDNASKFPEIKKDFETIQKINDELFLLNSSEKPLNYATVSEFASEINQRSKRLMSNLFPAEIEEKKKTPKNQTLPLELQDLKTLLSALDESINSFVHSPIFQNLKLVNLADSLKAQQDLEAVIKISQAIKIKTKI
jgi:PBP1b-binding outer membrane lipoprotein LpoB